METRDAREAVDAFRRYTEAFQSLDPRAPGQHFHQPALMVSPDGVFAVPDADAVARAYAGVMSRLPTLGYARSRFLELSGERLSPELAVVRGTCVWETADRKELQRFEISYTMRRVDGAWKILTALIYQP